jgi:hypothetical protein
LKIIKCLFINVFNSFNKVSGLKEMLLMPCPARDAANSEKLSGTWPHKPGCNSYLKRSQKTSQYKSYQYHKNIGTITFTIFAMP